MSKADIVSALRALDRTVAYYPVLGKALGTSNAGLFVCQMLYWEGRQRDPEGWIIKSNSDVETELGLSRHELDNVRQKLVKREICEYRLVGSPPVGSWKFNWQKVNEIVSDYVGMDEDRRAKIPPKPTTSQYEKRLAEFGKLCKDLEKQVRDLTRERDQLLKKGIVLTGIKPEREKPRPLPTAMAEVFDQYFQVYNPEAGKYRFTDKDFGQLKNLEKALRARNLEQKQTHAKKKGETTDNLESTDQDVIDAWTYLLEHLPQWYRDNSMTPAAINGNLMAIIQQIKKEASIKPTNDSKTDKGNPPTNPFAAAYKREGHDPK